MEEQEDDELLFGCIESGSEISVRGYGHNLDVELKYESGADNWIVRCKCGAEFDDGERMVACEICEIWQHILCGGIDDSEEVPALFICETCCTSLAPQRSHQCVLDFQNDNALTTTSPFNSDLLGNASIGRCWELYKSKDGCDSTVSIRKLYC